MPLPGPTPRLLALLTLSAATPSLVFSPSRSLCGRPPSLAFPDPKAFLSSPDPSFGLMIYKFQIFLEVR